MSCCVIYTILTPATCDCLLTLVDPSGHQVPLNLFGATVRELSGGDLHIQTLTGGAKVAAASGITKASIDALICSCHV